MCGSNCNVLAYIRTFHVLSPYTHQEVVYNIRWCRWRSANFLQALGAIERGAVLYEVIDATFFAPFLQKNS